MIYVVGFSIAYLVYETQELHWKSTWLEEKQPGPFMHVALSPDDEILASCDSWHETTEEECEVAERWTIVRSAE